MTSDQKPSALGSASSSQPFEQFPDLAAYIERMAASGVTGSMADWCAFLNSLNAALAPALAAPDMYEALSEFPAESDYSNADYYRVAVIQWWDTLAYPAITKAEGQS